ncbi:MAG: alpha/beta fold hydrolase [Salinivenus sp.]
MSSTASFPSLPSRTLRTPAGTLVYTDVGTGPPVVFLHGNPTSAYLYRHLIRPLASDYRCVAPDLLGFGRSAAPPDASYRPPAHAARIERLLRQLDLTDLTLVLHDWGGPIGLSYALRHPGTVHRLVLMNTWAWPLTHRPLVHLVSRLVGTPLGRHLVERHNFFARVMMPCTTGRATSGDWIAAYADALDSRPRRRACWQFARSLVAETPWLRALWTDRHRLPNVPALLCWGMADPAFGTEACLRRWHACLPEARVHRLPAVGHYVPEELGPALVPLVRSFLQATR